MNWLHSVQFSDSDISELQQLLYKLEGVPYRCERELSGIWLHTKDYDGELRLLILGQLRVTVSRVCFIRQRAGVMTKVLGWLEQFCWVHGIQSVQIQCVETEAMANWCAKNQFEPVPHSSMILGGIMIGDYQKTVCPACGFA